MYSSGERWWSVEELGEGARVVRSKHGVAVGEQRDGQGQGVEREVWVLRVGGADGDTSESAMPLTL
jgi:hypothetical protein